ncbi:hypothetical protein HBH69_094720 [Parastagonospora nodorum]|nr:hypothetical protein HBI06_053070 [Parastagonospora nodorum]KAH4248740.1 hypothetical protein HBI05_023410 [Parastagonospora nodorum]KAH4611007.1 hypothetical protein HBH82_040530 [Parastagonospora nodorum]KAH4693626.1 hypothetical protein HBH78_076520 [Parastagonospora nodorum]KAH4694287.1 hypothetical protein HBH67_216400 [Parastagonospora nodorum]
MGSSSSKRPQFVDPRHVCTSPDQVRSQFLKVLYRWDETRLDEFRALFLSRASKDNASDPAYWPEETVIAFLVERNPDTEIAVRNAGPLLYKMMLHYGSFPFPVEEGKRMTCDIFLRSIYMMSRTALSVLWRDYGSIGGVPQTRQRRPVDDVRLLFQSMASEKDEEDDAARTEDDDEDLLDVLFFVMHRVQEERSPKCSSKRESVKKAASALPSSCSRNLGGTVERGDLRSMLELIIVLLNSRVLGTMAPPNKNVIGCMMNAFMPASSEHLGSEWETFRNVVLGSCPNLIAILSAFIERSFQITNFFWLQAETLPKSLNEFRGIVSQSNIISADQLSQLLLVIPVGLVLHFNNITYRGEFVAEHASQIASHLQTPGRLLIGRCLDGASAHDPQIICAYTGFPDMYDGYLSSTVAPRSGSMVFSLTPTHEMYAAEKQEIQLNIGVKADPNEVSQDEQAGIMEIPDGKCLLEVEIGSLSLERLIGAFELWTM